MGGDIQALMSQDGMCGDNTGINELRLHEETCRYSRAKMVWWGHEVNWLIRHGWHGAINLPRGYLHHQCYSIYFCGSVGYQNWDINVAGIR